jgi:hypothetical protein
MKAIPTVHQLRINGHPVEISHIRQYFKYDSRTGKKSSLKLSYEEYKDMHPDFHLDAKGGVTLVTIFDSPKREKACSVVVECSNYDAYNRKTGVKIGIGRAYKMLTSGEYNVTLVNNK